MNKLANDVSSSGEEGKHRQTERAGSHETNDNWTE